MLDRYVVAAPENARTDFHDVHETSTFLSDNLRHICADAFSLQFTIFELDLEDIVNCGGDYLSD